MAEQDQNNNAADADTAVETPAETVEKPAQQVTVEEIGPARRKLTIELPESRIQEKIQDSYNTLQSEAVIPGFRMGRAPMRLVRKRFGSAVKDDVKGQLIGESYEQALEEHSLDVIGEPDVKDIENLELPESGSLTYEVEVEITPDVQLPDFSNINVKREKVEVTDEDVDAEIKQMCERFGRMQQLEDGEIEAEDYVTASVRVLAGEDAGDDAEELANHPSTYILVHGENHDFKGHVAGIVVQDMGKRLIGKKIGHQEKVFMTGPSGHEDERIKDQPITLDITVQGVQRLVPAELDQLQQAMGVESEDQLKDRIRMSLEQQAERKQSANMHKQVSDQLVQQVELELPEGLTSRQTERVLARKKMEMYYQGKGEAEVEEAVAEMRSASEEDARRELKLFFILDKAAKDLEVEVDEEELNGRIAMQAMQQQRRPEKVRQEMQERGELQHLYMQIREQKTLDAIVEKANVDEVEPGELSDEEQASAS